METMALLEESNNTRL